MSLTVDVRHRAGELALSASFSVPEGLSVLFGPSGAGKSLLLRLIAGLEHPKHGRVALHGRILCDTATGVHERVQARRIGIVFQESLLLPHRDVLGNVALGVRGGNRRERRNAALLWLERVGADGLAERRPDKLSGGEQQRVALARALAGEPRLLLLDEPFNALDSPVRSQLGALVRDLVHRHRLPALLVTHDPDEARALADRVVTARSGVIRAAPAAEQVLRIA